MKRTLTILSLLFTLATASWAQMSDDQVVSYIKTHNANGESQQEIAVSLLKMGVSQSQLQRIRAQYANQENATSAQTTGNGIDRSRVANGETEPTVEEGVLTETKSKIFGHDIFRSKKLSFEPSMNIATPSKYTLGPGDELILDIYGASQVNTKNKIAPDGTITIEKIGPVSVSGLTVAQAQSRVRSVVGAHYQGSTIKLSVGQTRTIMVNVLGEVTTPGTYTLSAFSTVFNALYLAGGITDIGTMRAVKVSRNGKVVSTVDIYEFIVNGRLAGNVMLQDNDVIMVGPYENLVEITGKVKRPMFYEMKKNESLQSLLTLAGGFTGDAFKQKVRIERKSSEGLTVHNVDEWDFNSFYNEDGDVVVVAPIIERYKNMVSVEGAVFRPGNYKISENANSVKTIIEQAGGLMEQAVTQRAVLTRMKADRTLTTIAVDLDGILAGRTPDIPLQNEDVLTIASAEKITSARFVHIEGEVLTPGNYPYSENATIEDLITLAGGVKETASLENIEVARRITSSSDNVDGNQMAKVFTFNLKEGLSIEGSSDFKLMPYDFITVHQNPDYQEQRRITINGEVKYAGTYILSNKEERLSEIIKRAGGLTTKAYTKGAQLTRRFSKKEMELKLQLIEMARTETDSIEARKQMDKTSYGVGIDMAKALEAPGSFDDIVLMEGDSIYVPKLNNVVKISGEVLYPNTVSYSKKKGASYYLNQAGGVSKTGEKSQAYIVYANGQVNTLKKGDIEPGCEIVVPSKIEKKVDTAKVSMWATLSSSIATVGAVVSTILK